MADDANDPEEQKPSANFKSSRLLLLVILLGVGLAVFAGYKTASRRPPGAPPADSSWGFLVWPLTFVSFFIILRILAWRQQKKFAALGKLNDEAIALLQAGELAAASKLLDGVVRSCDASPALKCVWEYNRGLAHMRQGHMSTAISAFNAALGSKSALKGIEAIITRMRCDLAICHACNGDLDAAEQAQARAHDRAAADTHGALLLMDVLIGLRRGRPAFVLKDAEAGWLRAEGSLSPHQVKALRLLSAFGHSQLPDAPAHAEHIEQMLAGVRPFRPGEFDYLVGNWPEFRAFLERNGFVAA